MNCIGQVESLVAVGVQERDIARVADGSLPARQPRRAAEEEVAEQGDGVGDVRVSILVQVARPLAPALGDAGVREAGGAVFDAAGPPGAR